MLILCFSDSHGNIDAMKGALRKHQNAELVIFLGDGLSDAEYAALDDNMRMWLAVRGNCDFKNDFMSAPVKNTEELTLFGKKILMTHGHIYGAKSSLYGLMELAEARQADLVLFGHTHTPALEYRTVGDRAVYFFNPGALHDDYFNKPSYGLIEINDNAIRLTHEAAE